MKIYCCECGKNRGVSLITGKEAYPHRKDLFKIKFWKCDTCRNFVGTHKDGKNTPLGCIPNKEIKEIRKQIHDIIDPFWKDKDISRIDIYSRLSKELGYEYHTAGIRTTKEGNRILEIVKAFKASDFKTSSHKYIDTCLLLGSIARGGTK